MEENVEEIDLIDETGTRYSIKVFSEDAARAKNGKKLMIQVMYISCRIMINKF